jgi:hypothetical protein
VFGDLGGGLDSLRRLQAVAAAAVGVGAPLLLALLGAAAVVMTETEEPGAPQRRAPGRSHPCR